MSKEDLTTVYVEPISFYMRSSDMRSPSNGAVEIVAVVKTGKSVVYRLSDLQLAHLACDATLQTTKAFFNKLASEKKL